MDPAPHVLRSRIENARASLDRHLDELGMQFDVTKERLKVNAQLWGGISAVAAGLLATVVFWPRRVERRRVARPFGRASAA